MSTPTLRDTVNRLRSLRVVLGVDSPEVRGWAPAVRMEAQRTVDAAIIALTAPEQSPADGPAAPTSGEPGQAFGDGEIDSRWYITRRSDTPQAFIDYVARNYYGEVVFHDPAWHAKRLYRAAMSAAPGATPPSAAQAEGARRELSAEQIEHLWDTHVGEPTAQCPLSAGDRLAFARAVIHAYAALTAAPEKLEGQADALRFQWLCEHPDWHFIERLCREFAADSSAEFGAGLRRVIDARRAVELSLFEEHAPAPHQQAAQPEKPAAWRVFICPEVMHDGTVGGNWSYSTARIGADYEPVTAAQLVAMANAATRDPSADQLQAAVLSAVGGAPPNYALAGWRAGCAAISRALQVATPPSPQQAAHGGERELFEAEMRCEAKWGHKSLKRDKGGCYLNSWTAVMWNVWQAASATASHRLTEADETIKHLTAALREETEAPVFDPEGARAAQGGREGLTEEQIEQALVRHHLRRRPGPSQLCDAFINGARFAERHHGIGITTPAGDSE